MTVFYVLFIILVLSSLSFRNNKLLGIILLFLLAFVCAFRGINVGSDTINYYTNNFLRDVDLENIGSSYGFEFLFVSVSNFIAKAGLDSRWCLFFLAIVTFVFLYLATKRFNKREKTSLVLVCLFYFILGFYAMTFNIARQLASASILLYAYTFLYEKGKKCLWFFFWVLVATSLHLSSALWIVIFIARYIDFSFFKKRKFLTAILTVGLYVIVQLARDVFLGSLLSSFGQMSFYEKYVDQTMTSDTSVLGYIIVFLEYGLLLYVFFGLSKRKDSILCRLLLMSIILNILFSAFYGNIYRVRIGCIIVETIAVASYFTQKRRFLASTQQLRFSAATPKRRLSAATPKRGLTTMDFLVLMAFIVVYGYESLSSLARGAYDIIPYYITL